MNVLISKLGGSTQGDSATNLQTALSSSGSASASALTDGNNSVNQTLSQSDLASGVSDAMNDPAFRSAFAANNAGLMASMKAQMDGNKNAANLKDLTDTLKDKDKMLSYMENPELALATFKNLLNKLTDEQLKAFTASANGSLAGIQAERELSSVEKSINSILKDSKSDDRTNIGKAISLDNQPQFMNDAILNTLKSLSPESLSQAMMGALSSNPDLMDSLANKELLGKMGLSPAEMKSALLNSMKDSGARPCVCSGLIV